MRIFSGQFKNREIKSLKGKATRPTTGKLREALFNIIYDRVEEAEFLDLFSGSGAIGFEAISRGAKSVTFVDLSCTACQIIQENAKRLGCTDQCRFLSVNVTKALKQLEQEGKSFDIIFVDPPYNQGFGKSICENLQKSSLLKPTGLFFLEEGKEFNPDEIQGFELISKRAFGISSLFEWKRH